jgi:hypothetical protein
MRIFILTHGAGQGNSYDMPPSTPGKPPIPPLPSGPVPVSSSAVRKALLLALATVLLCGAGALARDRADPPVVIPQVKGNATTTRFGNGYLTRSSDGTSYRTSKFGNGWITRSSDGKIYTTTRFGDGAITRGPGQQVTTRRFGSGTISRSSDGTTTTSQRFGSGTINRSSSGAGTTTSKFGSGYLTRANGSARAKDQTGVMVLPAPSPRQTNKLPDQTTRR